MLVALGTNDTMTRMILNHDVMALIVAASPHWIGKAVFITVFVLLILLLIGLPPRLADPSDGPRPWWRSARWWAVLVVLAQIAIYAWWG